MRYFKKEYIAKKIEVQFNRVVRIPPWIFPLKQCNMCDVAFDCLDYAKDMVVVAEDPELRFYFCEKCWNSDKDFISMDSIHYDESSVSEDEV